MKTATKTFTYILLALFLCGIVTAVYVITDYNSAVNEGDGNPSNTVSFTIEEGETVDSISKKLKEKGLIKNEYYFKFYVMQSGIADKLQAGSFTIPHHLSMKEIGDLLQNAQFPDIWVTIPEGVMALEVADYLEEAFSQYPENSFSREEFLAMVDAPPATMTSTIPIPANAPLEGYLFPDTYRFPPDATTEYVLGTILATFRQRIYDPNMKAIEESGYSLYDILIFASILERETKHSGDRPAVADILLRRLENNWALEVDATLLYHFGDWTRVITAEDLEIDSPYNTRKFKGLPPTPIANPGEETVEAVLYPSSNDYWYYISDQDGNLHYAVTLDEHNNNIYEYLR